MNKMGEGDDGGESGGEDGRGKVMRETWLR